MDLRRCVALIVLVSALSSSRAAAAVPAVIVKVNQPIQLDDPQRWPAITAEHHMVATNGESARWIACYDNANLYLLVRVHDDSPLKNSAAEPAMIIKGGDAVGFCFGAPGGGSLQRIVVGKVDDKAMAVCYRPTSSEKKPYSFASPVSTYVMDYVAPLPQVQVACSTIQGGYAVGVAIPWSVLGLSPAKGLEFPFDAQVIFSDPSGTKNIATAWWHSRGNGPACTVDLPTEAHLYPDLWGTAQLFATDPGPQPETDPLVASTVTDPEGGLQPVPITFTMPRACNASLVITDATGFIVAEPLRAEPLSAGPHTVEWNGRGYRDMPLPAGEYHWRLGIFDEVTSHFYGAAGNSGHPPYPSKDKKGSIGGVHVGPSAVAADAGGIYLLHAGEEGEPGLRKVTSTGDVLWTHSTNNYSQAPAVAVEGNRAYMLAGFPALSLVCMDATTGRDQPMGTAGPRILLGDMKKLFTGLAVVGGRAYVSVSTENRLAVINVVTGAPEADIPLPHPGRVARQDATHLLAISNQSVVRIDLATNTITPFLTNLTAPSAITADNHGNIYIAECGTKQQITQFDAEGKPLRTYGKPGGRAATVLKYDPLEFRNIVDLTIDADDCIWFVESGWTAPRRIGCVSIAGQWVRDYCGPVYCSSGMVVDLDDPATVYYHVKASWMKTHIRYSPTHSWRDYDWNIESIFYLSQSGTDTPVTPDLMLAPATPSFAEGITFTGTNGKRYFWIDGEATYTRHHPAALWIWENDHWVPAGIQEQKGKFFWTDKNGDGLVQSEEIGTQPSPDFGWRWLGRDLTLYGRRGTLAPAHIDARGVPCYEGGVYTPYLTTPPSPMLAKVLDGECAVSPPAADGATYYTTNPGNGQGRAFWDRASENKLIKVKDGKLQWWVGHHDAANHTAGDGTFLYNVCGVVDGVIVVCDVANQYTAYTDDGLTLGWLLKDENGRPRWSDDSYVSAESFSGQFIKDPTTGKYLLFAGASESCQVREVLGIKPGDITRQTGTITLTSSMPRTTPTSGVAAIPYGTWECANGRFDGVDGEDWEWWPVDYNALTIRDNKQVVGDIRLRRDAGYLQCFADVLQTEAFHPEVSASPADLYGKADGVELLLGPSNPADRQTAQPTDTRVFLTARQDEKGKLIGLAYFTRPSGIPVAPSPALRRMSRSGPLAGSPPTAPIDATRELTLIPGAQVSIGVRPDGHGFRLEAEIPLALFPDLTTVTPVTFKRWTDGGNQWIKKYTEPRADLTGPIRLNAAIFTTDAAGKIRRLPWLADGLTGTDPLAMSPAKWGVAETSQLPPEKN